MTRPCDVLAGHAADDRGDRQHLDDPNIGVADSCAVPDHPVMSRLWTERKPIGTLVVGLTPEADRAVGKAARQLASAARARQALRPLAGRIKALMRCGG